MKAFPRNVPAVIGIVCCIAAPGDVVAPDDARTDAPGNSVERARVVHLMNRIAFGPRPGDVDRIIGMGVDRYIERQLQPARIPDTALARAIGDFAILDHSSEDLLRLLRELRAAQRLAQRRDPAPGDPAPPPRSRLPELLGEFQQLAVVRAVRSERQLLEIMVDFWTNHFNVFLGKGASRALMPSYIEETIRPHALGRFEDLFIATARSPAMLYYLDNTQSVAAGAVPPQLRRGTSMGGRQQEMLPPSPRQQQQRRRADSLRARARLPRDVNENYARELLELHTLSVDGGYTQHDIVDVARIFTGWRVQMTSGRMVFHEWAHDRGEKTVLGHRFPPGRGMQEGLELLGILAAHPSTMRHVSGKLCARLVSDTPPPGCIEAAVGAWNHSGGQLRAVVRAIVTSPEFWDEANREAKLKTPLEYVVSAVRALGAAPDTTPAHARLVASLGQPLYRAEPPTGYAETEDAWVNAGALLGRLNVARALASGRIPGMRAAIEDHFPLDVDPVERVNRVVLNGMAGANTLRVMRALSATARNRPEALAGVIALALASPEFQRQ